MNFKNLPIIFFALFLFSRLIFGELPPGINPPISDFPAITRYIPVLMRIEDNAIFWMDPELLPSKLRHGIHSKVLMELEGLKPGQVAAASSRYLAGGFWIENGKIIVNQHNSFSSGTFNTNYVLTTEDGTWRTLGPTAQEKMMRAVSTTWGKPLLSVSEATYSIYGATVTDNHVEGHRFRSKYGEVGPRVASVNASLAPPPFRSPISLPIISVTAGNSFPTKAVIGGTALGVGTYLFPEAVMAHQILSTWYPTMVLGSGARAGGGMLVYAAGGTAVPATAAGSFLYGGLWIATEARARQDLFESLAIKSMTQDLSTYEQMWLNNSFGSGSARAKVHMANMVNESVFGSRKKPTTLALLPEVAPKKTNQSTDYLKPLQDLMEEYEKNPYKYLFGSKRDQPDAPDYSSDPLDDEDLSEIFLELDDHQIYSFSPASTDPVAIAEPIPFDDFDFSDDEPTPE